jgi:hypothetical protein
MRRKKKPLQYLGNWPRFLFTQYPWSGPAWTSFVKLAVPGFGGRLEESIRHGEDHANSARIACCQPARIR